MPPLTNRSFFFSVGIVAIIMCAVNIQIMRFHPLTDAEVSFANYFNTNVDHSERNPRAGNNRLYVANRNQTQRNQHSLQIEHSKKLTATNIDGNDARTTGQLADGVTSASTKTQNAVQNITTLAQARKHLLTPINSSPIHTSQYTIRMNSWRRNEQLLISINHHAKCEGVAAIQIIWCDMENEPPSEVVNHKSGKIVIERHTINSLNERYKILEPPPTLGILSLDDDVLRPCEVLDATFIRWTRHPERIVGFYARSHLPASATKSSNIPWTYNKVAPHEQYSMTLPSKIAFIHRDYLNLYIATLPRPIYEHIDKHFNCEDIAMSYFVSAMTEGRPPLLGDHWAVATQIQLYSDDGLSWKIQHIVSQSVLLMTYIIVDIIVISNFLYNIIAPYKGSRNNCVNDFAKYLGLKEGGKLDDGLDVIPLKFGQVQNDNPSCFGYGDEPECWSKIDPHSFSHAPRLRHLVEDLQHRESIGESDVNNTLWLSDMRVNMQAEAKRAGLVKGSLEYKLRWQFKCPRFSSSDKQTQFCAIIKPMKFTEQPTIPVCDITNGVLMYMEPPKGMSTREYAATITDDSSCDIFGDCSSCMLTSVATDSCNVTINQKSSTIEAQC